ARRGEDALLREHRSQSGCRRGDASLLQAFTQPFQGSLDSHSRGVFGKTEPGADLTPFASFKIAPQDRLPIRISQLQHGGIDLWPESIPSLVCRRCVIEFTHGMGFLFTHLAASFATNGLARGETSTLVQPTGERSKPAQARATLRGALGQIAKH